jgi:hypothetical protein
MRVQLQARTRGLAHRRRERGAVLVLVVLSMIALIAFVGLALDLGKLYVAKSELQNSADACALSAARDINGITPLAVSEAAGIAAGHLNRALFQSLPVSMDMNNNVTYATSFDGLFYNKGDSNVGALSQIAFVQCTTALPNIPNWLIQVLNVLPGMNVGPTTVSARAVATNGHAQTSCALPVFICAPPSGQNYSVGQWLQSKVDSSTGSYTQGMFGWANLNLNGTNPCTGANCLADQLAGTTCNVPAVGQQVGENGNISSLRKSYNTRFGIQYNGNSAPQGTSDFTGYAYTSQTTWKSASNAYDGTSPSNPGAFNYVSSRTQRLPYQGDATSGLNTKGSPGSSGVYQGGADRRLVPAPMVNCDTMNSSQHATITGWACVLMLDPMQQGGNSNAVHLEYRGLASAPGSPCSAQGVPGGANGIGPLVPELIQ